MASGLQNVPDPFEREQNQPSLPTAAHSAADGFSPPQPADIFRGNCLVSKCLDFLQFLLQPGTGQTCRAKITCFAFFKGALKASIVGGKNPKGKPIAQP